MTPMPAAPAGGRVDPAAAAGVMHLRDHTKLLAALLAEARSEILQIAVGDYHRQHMVLENFPIAGLKRAVVGRTGFGFPSFGLTTTPIMVVPGNEARLGGNIVNTGANPAFLFLTANDLDATVQEQAGIPCLYLAPLGAWDFRLGNVLWAGNVQGASSTGTTTLCVAEV